MITEDLENAIYKMQQNLSEMINDAYNAYLDDEIDKTTCDNYIEAFKEIKDVLFQRFPLI